jgi:glycosyltransferase involved in cell wall biosynthesis
MSTPANVLGLFQSLAGVKLMQSPATRVPAPLLSVAIPTYRGAAHLAAAIESVLAQTFSDYELIIVDDNSPDNTANIVASYPDPRIRYLRNENNLGPQGNWNRCLDEARGKYFKLLPQDDILMPECFAQQIAVMEEDTIERIALVFCARRIIGPADRVVMERGYPGGKRGTTNGVSVTRRCVRYGTNLIGEPGGVLFRTALARRVGAFDATNPYVIDLDYWFRLLAQGDAYYLPQPLASFRVSSGSWSVAIGGGQTGDFRKFIARTAAQPVYAIGRLDWTLGYLMAGVNTLLRQIFYRFMLKRTAS